MQIDPELLAADGARLPQLTSAAAEPSGDKKKKKKAVADAGPAKTRDKSYKRVTVGAPQAYWQTPEPTPAPEAPEQTLWSALRFKDDEERRTFLELAKQFATR